MRYVLDHDLHNHTQISPCSNDPRQTVEALLAYGLTNDFSLICVTDHLWDVRGEDHGVRGWPDFEAARDRQPYPQSRHCRVIFGIEADVNRCGDLAVSEKGWQDVDFAILSASHLNLRGFTIDPDAVGEDAASRKRYYQQRLHALLARDDVPFTKCGLSHFTISLVCEKDPIRWIELFSDAELEEIFRQVQKLGMGVELNGLSVNLERYGERDLQTVLRPYRIAKQCGCTFYFGGDAHHPDEFRGSKARFERWVEELQLEEKDKFPLVPRLIAENPLA